MDGVRFDALTRALTTFGSRRRALASAFGGALGIVLAASSVDEAAAKKKCPPCKKRKQGKCKKKKPNGTPCTGGSCQDGSCVATVVPPTPPPFCAGKNTCTDADLALCNAAQNCFCFVTETGGSFCGTLSAPNCTGCTEAGGTCVNADGPQCVGGLRCAQPCATP